MKIYVYRNAADCPYTWAEVDNGLPVHPGDLQDRVRALIKDGFPFATQSDIVLSMIGWMIRKGEITLPTCVVYVEKDGTQRENQFCNDGLFLMPWPEEGFESIQEAGFHYRFA